MEKILNEFMSLNPKVVFVKNNQIKFCIADFVKKIYPNFTDADMEIINMYDLYSCKNYCNHELYIDPLPYLAIQYHSRKCEENCATLAQYEMCSVKVIELLKNWYIHMIILRNVEIVINVTEN